MSPRARAATSRPRSRPRRKRSRRRCRPSHRSQPRLRRPLPPRSRAAADDGTAGADHRLRQRSRIRHRSNSATWDWGAPCRVPVAQQITGPGAFGPALLHVGPGGRSPRGFVVVVRRRRRSVNESRADPAEIADHADRSRHVARRRAYLDPSRFASVGLRRSRGRQSATDADCSRPRYDRVRSISSGFRRGDHVTRRSKRGSDLWIDFAATLTTELGSRRLMVTERVPGLSVPAAHHDARFVPALDGCAYRLSCSAPYAVIFNVDWKFCNDLRSGDRRGNGPMGVGSASTGDLRSQRRQPLRLRRTSVPSLDESTMAVSSRSEDWLRVRIAGERSGAIRGLSSRSGSTHRTERAWSGLDGDAVESTDRTRFCDQPGCRLGRSTGRTRRGASDRRFGCRLGSGCSGIRRTGSGGG